MLGIHNEAVKVISSPNEVLLRSLNAFVLLFQSMRHPPDDTYKRSKEKKDGKQEEETIDELIKEFEDGMDAKELVP